eukprot:CAMPEP_0181250788 /NCGR_PEP_ID=MMETSP1096-20121128/46508_1 /TAXON_ID=156174 ORGANISM="Chrysochromulina ericina, Strain CCMP281" /NCGR_SAMPLE_ID=MMETSP1096 /ASSEMBLY_ACC=CAM_ASM_000453 /LENGTH=72 /DNA_ID=CAMNT_0023348283 /DNA_START=618 /DNA_END=832 /DNA_ORIENTATION=+
MLSADDFGAQLGMSFLRGRFAKKRSEHEHGGRAAAPERRDPPANIRKAVATAPIGYIANAGQIGGTGSVRMT